MGAPAYSQSAVAESGQTAPRRVSSRRWRLRTLARVGALRQLLQSTCRYREGMPSPPGGSHETAPARARTPPPSRQPQQIKGPENEIGESQQPARSTCRLEQLPPARHARAPAAKNGDTDADSVACQSGARPAWRAISSPARPQLAHTAASPRHCQRLRQPTSTLQL